jgi:hypothetical protein
VLGGTGHPTLGLGKLAKKHGYELIPAAETLGVTLSVVIKDKIVKLNCDGKTQPVD